MTRIQKSVLIHFGEVMEAKLADRLSDHIHDLCAAHGVSTEITADLGIEIIVSQPPEEENPRLPLINTEEFFTRYSELVDYADFEIDYDKSKYKRLLQSIEVVNRHKSPAPLNLANRVWADLIYADVTKWITFNYDDFDSDTFEDTQVIIKTAVDRLWVRLNELISEITREQSVI